MRYYSLSTYMRQRYGRRIQKIPLDAGFTCPNRDGSISTTGCVFCNPLGSGSGMGIKGVSLSEQWTFWRERLQKKYKAAGFWAYLQSYSNTYGPPEKLRRVLESLCDLPDMVGLSIGTRPDCLQGEKLNLLRSYAPPETWIEIGLQSASDQTLRGINRGHDVSTFVRAVERVNRQGLRICVHIIAGLPGEREEDFSTTVDLVNALPVHGIKFHNLYVCKGSTLASLWKNGLYVPLGREQYITWLISALKRLRPEIVVQRLNADPHHGELLAPNWALQKSDLIRDVQQLLRGGDDWQGKDHSFPSERPAWFSPHNPFPSSFGDSP
ncbi:MAG: TIGR01212 family radical SAM protein [Desulfovibrionales bacterium]